MVYLLLPGQDQRQWYQAYFMGFIKNTNMVQVRIPMPDMTKYVVVRKECMRRMRLVRD
jgi:hypothetical protein